MKFSKKTIAIVAATLTLIMANPIEANAYWNQNSTGWWYTTGNSSYAKGWNQINGKWYHFDSEGYMSTGWVQDGANWYYLYEDGSMAHDCYVGSYYLNSSGAWTNSVSSGSSASSSDAIKDGTYKVGTDIAAGEYLVKATDVYGGYIECTSDSTGSFDSIIYNDNIASGANIYVTVKEGEYFQLKRCEMYPVAKAPSIIPSDGLYKDGMYKVGKDIPAGEYKVKVSKTSSYFDSGYYEISPDSRHREIINNDNITGDAYITIEDGQYLKLSRLELQR